ncbi:alpha/beta hydrolase family protein, partial [candidate division KSB1 bacterium]
MTKRQFIIEVSSDRKIYGDFRTPDNPAGNPIIIFCHGFKGFKDWGGWQYGLDKICAAGFFTISTNFSHNGVGSDLENFTELDKFEKNTIGLELEDLEILMDAVKNSDLFPELSETKNTGLIGHSRGGAAAILFASQHQHIKCLATWSSISGFDKYLSQRMDWRKQG